MKTTTRALSDFDRMLRHRTGLAPRGAASLSEYVAAHADPDVRARLRCAVTAVRRGDQDECCRFLVDADRCARGTWGTP